MHVRTYPFLSCFSFPGQAERLSIDTRMDRDIPRIHRRNRNSESCARIADGFVNAIYVFF